MKLVVELEVREVKIEKGCIEIIFFESFKGKESKIIIDSEKKDERFNLPILPGDKFIFTFDSFDVKLSKNDFENISRLGSVGKNGLVIRNILKIENLSFNFSIPRCFSTCSRILELTSPRLFGGYFSEIKFPDFQFFIKLSNRQYEIAKKTLKNSNFTFSFKKKK